MKKLALPVLLSLSLLPSQCTADYRAPATGLVRPCAPDACGPGFALCNEFGTVFYPCYNLRPCFPPEGNIPKDAVRFVAAMAPKQSEEKRNTPRDGIGSEYAPTAPRLNHPHHVLPGMNDGRGHGYVVPHMTLPHPGVHLPPHHGYPYPPTYPPPHVMTPPVYPPPYASYPYQHYPQPYAYPQPQPYPYPPATYAYPPAPVPAQPVANQGPIAVPSEPVNATPRPSGDLWLPNLMNEKFTGQVKPAQFSVETPRPAFSVNLGPSGGNVPLPQLPGGELAQYIPQTPAVGYTPNFPCLDYGMGQPTLPSQAYINPTSAALPAPGYTMMPPALPIPPGYLPPPPPQHPCFPSHPYARSPRDFFMWRENMEERSNRRRPLPLP